MTDRAVRIGVQIQPQHADYGMIRRAVAEAEDTGVDVIFTWDHFFPLSGDHDGSHFEAWTLLAAWAEATSRAEIGVLVSCNGYRNPDLLADMARTVDHISAGRLVLGVGSGWCERDFTEYGYPLGTPAGRLDDLAEALPRIDSRLAGLNPAPTRPIPLLIGGEGEKKTLRLVARHADIWHSFATPEVFERKSKVLDGHCAAIGRSPADIERSVGLNRFEHDEIAPAADLGPRLAALGATLFTVGVSGPEYNLDRLRSWISWRDQYNRDACRTSRAQVTRLK